MLFYPVLTQTWDTDKNSMYMAKICHKSYYLKKDGPGIGKEIEMKATTDKEVGCLV